MVLSHSPPRARHTAHIVRRAQAHVRNRVVQEVAVSYVGEPFTHDIFVSYSYGEPDASGTSRLQRWSQAFVRELENEFKILPQASGTPGHYMAKTHTGRRAALPDAPTPRVPHTSRTRRATTGR
jgi:hypothetical protein